VALSDHGGGCASTVKWVAAVAARRGAEVELAAWWHGLEAAARRHSLTATRGCGDCDGGSGHQIWCTGGRIWPSPALTSAPKVVEASGVGVGNSRKVDRLRWNELGSIVVRPGAVRRRGDVGYVGCVASVS
jgi:hypothetical protein